MNILLFDTSGFYADVLKLALLPDAFRVVPLPVSVKELESLSLEPELEPVELLLIRKGCKNLDYEELALSLKTFWPSTPIMIIGPFRGHKDIADMIERGISGYFITDKPLTSLVAAIEFVLSGEKYIPASALKDPEINTSSIMSQREHQVLFGMITGQTNKEIGKYLDLAEVTVKLHVKNVMNKLQAKNRGHAAAIAITNGVLPPHMLEQAMQNLRLRG